MQDDLPQGEKYLFTNHPLRLIRARGMDVACAEGIIWITVAGEAADIFLRPGEQHRLSSNRLTLIEAIGSGSVRLTPASNRLAGLFREIQSHGRQFAALGALISGNRT